MQRQRVIKNLFLILDEILTSGQIIFSRASLLSKLNKLAALNGATRCYMHQTIKRWEARKLFEAKKRGRETFYHLTPFGCRQINRYRFKTLEISDKKWDGWWRVVIFDIPESKRLARDALRRKLIFFGFYSLQKSVFICPFECRREIEILGDYFNVSEYIELFSAHLPRQQEEKLKRFFGL